MKQILLLCALFGLCPIVSALAQDAATEERLNQLNGKLENIIEAQRAQQKQIEALVKEIESLREQVSRPSGNYATQEELKRVWKSIEEVDQKRREDAEKTAALLTQLGKKLTPPTAPPKKNGTSSPGNPATTEKANEKGYPYTIRQGDTLSLIVQAYREKNIKVTTDQILKANPGLKAEKLKVGQEIWIPAPQ